jgi:hypothetical protein
MQDALLYERRVHPSGKSWEEWAAIWCNWMLSIPKNKNPSLDETGKNCSMNQDYEKVWFLTGTFGNINSFKRECTIPEGRAILFPILMKEDSLIEDSDLKTESELRARCRDAMNRVIHMEATIDGQRLDRLESFRVQSEAFYLTFPEQNAYDVRPGLTLSVCDGYWLFIKPLQTGKHYIRFKGETSLNESHTLAQLKKGEAHRRLRQDIKKKQRAQVQPTFKLEVSYRLTIIKS